MLDHLWPGFIAWLRPTLLDTLLLWARMPSMSILRITSPATLSSACAMSCIIWCVALSHRTHMVFSNLLRITNGLYFGVYQVCACITFSFYPGHTRTLIYYTIFVIWYQEGEVMELMSTLGAIMTEWYISKHRIEAEAKKHNGVQLFTFSSPYEVD